VTPNCSLRSTTARQGSVAPSALPVGDADPGGKRVRFDYVIRGHFLVTFRSAGSRSRITVAARRAGSASADPPRLERSATYLGRRARSRNRFSACLSPRVNVELAQDRGHVVVDCPVREKQSDLRSRRCAVPSATSPRPIHLARRPNPAGFCRVSARGPRGKSVGPPACAQPSRATIAAAGLAPQSL